MPNFPPAANDAGRRISPHHWGQGRGGGGGGGEEGGKHPTTGGGDSFGTIVHNDDGGSNDHGMNSATRTTIVEEEEQEEEEEETSAAASPSHGDNDDDAVVHYRLSHLTCSLEPTVSCSRLDYTRPGHPSDAAPLVSVREKIAAEMLTRLIIPNTARTSIRSADHHRLSLLCSIALEDQEGQKAGFIGGGQESLSIAHQRIGSDPRPRGGLGSPPPPLVGGSYRHRNHRRRRRSNSDLYTR